MPPPPLAAYVAPRPISVAKPAYPAEASRRHQQGRVIVHCDVGIDGTVSRVSLKSSSGYPLLDDAAVATARSWRFVPATRGGEAVAGSIDQPIDYGLED